MKHDILFELGTEELPSALVKPLAKNLLDLVLTHLSALEMSHAKARFFAGPRRIGFSITDVPEKQENRQQVRRGPAAAAAHDEQGNPSKALLGFARSCGVEIDALSLETTEKGQWWIYQFEQGGRLTREVLPEIIQKALASVNIPKPMRWGAETFNFARPVHWAVLMYAEQVIETDILGVKTGNLSYGHRFLHPQAVEIVSSKAYEDSLYQAKVIVDFDKRRDEILHQIELLAKQHQFHIPCPPDLIDEITSINEWPIVYIANYADEFLKLPAEVLIASMQGHQKCLPVYNRHHQLLAHFIGVSNIESLDMASVIRGNEKVMRARLSDAAFFYEQDRSKPLSHYASLTETVVFEKRLGSLADKTKRVKEIALHLAKRARLESSDVIRAVSLSKADLMTGLVNEFPELQGLIGQYYAIADGEKEILAKALFEQYLPRFSGDELPQSDLGFVLSLAERLDTLVGIFAIGLKPSGEKDPYKLRRHALAIVRLMLQKPNQLALSELLQIAAKNYDFLNIGQPLLEEIKQFILERMQSLFQQLNYAPESIQAGLKVESDVLYDFSLRLLAYHDFIRDEHSEALLQAAKRVGQILAQANVEPRAVDVSLFQEPSERQLWMVMQDLGAKLEHDLSLKNYPQAFSHLLALSHPLVGFFEHVFVMADDMAVRQNRLNLLQNLQSHLQSIVSLSR
jgi:glycyl-tRNA synthetase beta chain